MELTMERVKEKYPDIIAAANNPDIRQFVVPDKFDFNNPCTDVASGNWVSADSKTILEFSAVAYFFAKEIHAQYKVPIGLINSALGGSPAEAWLSEDALKEFPAYYDEAQKFKNIALIAQIENHDREVENNWYSLLHQQDEGISHDWKSPSLQDADWKEMAIPGYWANGDLKDINGVVWFRKEIVVPASMVGQPAKLLLGRIVDADSVFINGIFIGTTSYQYPPRRYAVPATVLKEGRNTIVVRVINNAGQGGFVPDKPYTLSVHNEVIDLKGNWKYRLGARMDALPSHTFIRWKPLGLYNAMIAPLLNYPIKGVIWYQGEANTNKPDEYGALFKTLITDWRAKWNQGDFPFLYVQLANFMEVKKTPSESNWAALRQAQLNTLSVPNTGMAVTIDAGEWNDIHPLNKQVVGQRLALLAKRLAYGDKKVISAGPVYQSMEIKGNKIIIHFSNTGSGLMAKGNTALTYFSIAGADKKFMWAKAMIKDHQVIVWNDAIAHPVAVRYAWADNPAGANLYSKEGLPASPFEAVKQ
jgi:sialate O-acetylesterase